MSVWGDRGGPMAGAIALLMFLLFVLLWPAITTLAIALVGGPGSSGDARDAGSVAETRDGKHDRRRR